MLSSHASATDRDHAVVSLASQPTMSPRTVPYTRIGVLAICIKRCKHCDVDPGSSECRSDYVMPAECQADVGICSSPLWTCVQAEQKFVEYPVYEEAGKQLDVASCRVKVMLDERSKPRRARGSRPIWQERSDGEDDGGTIVVLTEIASLKEHRLVDTGTLKRGERLAARCVWRLRVEARRWAGRGASSLNSGQAASLSPGGCIAVSLHHPTSSTAM